MLNYKRPNLVPEGVDFTMLLDIDAEVSTNGTKPMDSEILAEVCGINNAVLSDNDQDDDKDGAVRCQHVRIQRKFTKQLRYSQSSVYCENGKDIQAAVQICSTLAFHDIIINKKKQTITFFFVFKFLLTKFF